MKRLTLLLLLFFSLIVNSQSGITNLTTTTDNGVERVTNNQNCNASIINGETVILDNPNSRLRAVSSSGLLIENSQIKCDSDITGANDNSAPITFGPRNNTTNKLRVTKNSSILFDPLTARKNIFLSELSDSNVIESGNTGNLFVYTQTDAILQNCVFRGINVWEVYRTPSIASNIFVDNANYGYLNWEAGRLDFLGFSVSNIVVSDAWLGAGNGGNNSAYHWNNDVSFDNTNIRLQSGNNQYWEGYSFSPQFKDRFTNLNVENVLVIYDSDLSGTRSELARFTTNADGKLVGTYDSRNQTNASNQERETLFIVTAKSNISGSTHSSGGGNTYSIDVITPYIEVRSFLHQPVAGYSNTDTFPISSSRGVLKSDYSVNTFETFNLVPDFLISENNKALVDAYTEIDTSQKFYDRVKAEWRDNDDFPLVDRKENEIILDPYNLIIDPTAGNAYSISSNTMTIKATTFVGNISTTGVVTQNNGATIYGGYKDNTGTYKFLDLEWTNNLSPLNVSVVNLDDNSQIIAPTSATTTYTGHFLMPNPVPTNGTELRITSTNGSILYNQVIPVDDLEFINLRIILKSDSTEENQKKIVRLTERLLAKVEAINNSLTDTTTPILNINETLTNIQDDATLKNQEAIINLLQSLLKKVSATREAFKE